MHFWDRERERERERETHREKERERESEAEKKKERGRGMTHEHTQHVLMRSYQPVIIHHHPVGRWNKLKKCDKGNLVFHLS